MLDQLRMASFPRENPQSPNVRAAFFNPSGTTNGNKYAINKTVYRVQRVVRYKSAIRLYAYVLTSVPVSTW